jgi:hypothetical protein
MEPCFEDIRRAGSDNIQTDLIKISEIHMLEYYAFSNINFRSTTAAFFQLFLWMNLL